MRKQLTEEDLKLISERYELAAGRLSEVKDELIGYRFDAYLSYFADFLALCIEVYEHVGSLGIMQVPAADLENYNRLLYGDILPGNYESSFTNAGYIASLYGRKLTILSAYAFEFRAIIPYLYEQDLEQLVLRLELYLELFGILNADEEREEADLAASLKENLYWYVSDYSEIAAENKIAGMVDYNSQYAVSVMEQADLSNPDYLYRFGEYVTEEEIRTARHLATLSGERIKLLADTFTEGYRRGFVNAGKPLSKKKTVNIRYSLGFERIVLKAIENFRAMGLEPTVYRASTSLFFKRSNLRIGYYGAIPNRQYDYDHREDEALILDAKLSKRKLECLTAAFELYKDEAQKHAGPACLEVFGEVPFSPAESSLAPVFNKSQQKQSASFQVKNSEITNSYVPGEERSFTIMALPMPAIGPNYEELFDRVVEINTLDYEKYKLIQQKLIDALDKAYAVRILGSGENHTDLTVHLRPLTNPLKETKFENCLADVNIPVGEVFTSPVLRGTSGTLCVSRVFLNDLEYRDLSVTFTDGMVTGYSCSNFERPEDGERYFKDNVLYHHDSLPLGEFAIGTNTTAYAISRQYGIEDRMPILIAEKMGPHFAVGDTCYSHEEEVAVYNPDGKEIVARDNEVSALRETEPEKAYFGCHTDITIPYSELLSIEALLTDGSSIEIIKDGRFTLAGCEELNRPFGQK